MKQIDFNFITIQNFLSIGNEEIRIDLGPGIHIITGNNNDKEDSKNGVGKSSIADAFFFALFGSPLRPIKKDSIANWANNKSCCVCLEFGVIENGNTKHYTIIRSLRPNKVKLVEDGNNISRTTPKTNQTIIDIIGTDSSLFEQSVIMCLNQVEPFLAKTPAVKRKFIEDIFTIEIFGQMTKYIREDHNETQKTLDTETDKIEDLKKNIDLWAKQQEKQKQKKEQRIQELTNRIKDTEEEIVFWENKKTESSNITDTNTGKLKEKTKTLRDKEKTANVTEREITGSIASDKSTIRSLVYRITELQGLSEGVCAYCKQPFSESNIKQKKKLIAENQKLIEEGEENISSSQSNVDKIEGAIEKIKTALQKTEREIEKTDAEKRERDKIDIELKNHKTRFTQTQSDLKAAQEETDTSQENIEELNKRLSSIEETVNEHEHKLAIIDAAKFVVSDEGVKNFIVKKMLKMMNGRLNYYLKKLDANCACEFNEYFEENTTNNRGQECSYFNFSGGEKKRIDLAMLFTFNDIRRKQSNVSFNMSLYDELLDTALDSKGIELTLEILKDRVLNNEEAIYVISHKNEAIKHATGEIIYLEKENDVTKRKPYV
jgi:DNA repair exonuclease SbcCD ATPase subunit